MRTTKIIVTPCVYVGLDGLRCVNGTIYPDDSYCLACEGTGLIHTPVEQNPETRIAELESIVNELMIRLDHIEQFLPEP